MEATEPVPDAPPLAALLPRRQPAAPPAARPRPVPQPAELTAGAARELDVMAHVAHELRGPLMALAVSAELMVQDFPAIAPERMREMLRAMQCRAVWLQGLAENLLYAALAEQGRVRLQRQPIDLMEVALEIRPVVEPALQQKGQRLRFRVRKPLPEVAADGRRVGQVLVNLILNAAKYSGPGTPVEVRLSRHRDAVRIAVCDRGPGLPPDAAGRLFQPFYRARTATRSGADGVGLGLAIVRSIVDAHGGQVGAGNRRGGGASFWLDLPIAPIAPVR